MFINVSPRTDGDYGLRSVISNLPNGLLISRAQLTLWGVPAAASNDAYRGSLDCNGGSGDPVTDVRAHCVGSGASAGVQPRPFLTTPTNCQTPTPRSIRVRSWENTEPSTSSTSVCSSSTTAV